MTEDNNVSQGTREITQESPGFLRAAMIEPITPLTTPTMPPISLPTSIPIGIPATPALKREPNGQHADFGGDRVEDEDRVDRLEREFRSFSNNANTRLNNIEASIERLNNILAPRPADPQPSDLTDKATNPDPTASTDTTSSEMIPSMFRVSSGMFSPTTAPVSPLTAPIQPTLAIEQPTPAQQRRAPAHLRVSNVETKWFTKRPYAEFHVHVMTPEGRIMSHTDGWQLRLRLVSGHGLYLDHFLNAPSLTFPIVNGHAEVSGLKFTAVSSRNGGFFQFELSVRHPPNSGVLPIRSEKIKVLSERLKNETKAGSILDLHASDPLLRVPGIGKKYAARLSDIGIHTVADLAAVETAHDSERRRKQLLETVRKDRGALTEAKLADMMQDAAAVARRAEDSGMASNPNPNTRSASDMNDHESDSGAPPAKRMRVEEGYGDLEGGGGGGGGMGSDDDVDLLAVTDASVPKQQPSPFLTGVSGTANEVDSMINLSDCGGGFTDYMGDVY